MKIVKRECFITPDEKQKSIIDMNMDLARAAYNYWNGELSANETADKKITLKDVDMLEFEHHIADWNIVQEDIIPTMLDSVRHQLIRDWDKAKSQGMTPRFKSKKMPWHAFVIQNYKAIGVELKDGYIEIPKLGKIKVEDNVTGEFMFIRIVRSSEGYRLSIN